MRNWVICSEVDGPRVSHTEWSKSEREKQIPYAGIGRVGGTQTQEGRDMGTYVYV